MKPLGVKRWVACTVVGTILVVFLLSMIWIGSHELIAYDVRTAKDAKGYTIENVINEKMFFGHKGRYDYHVRGILTHDVVVDGYSPDGEDSDKNHNPRKGTETIFIFVAILVQAYTEIRTIIPARGRKLS